MATQTLIFSYPETEEDYALEVRLGPGPDVIAQVWIGGKFAGDGSASALTKEFGFSADEERAIAAAVSAARPIVAGKRRERNGLYDDPESMIGSL